VRSGARAVRAALRLSQVTSMRPLAVVTVPLESMGESITSAVVVKWTKGPGDGVKVDDVIAVVETDKVTVDIRAKVGGTFVEKLCTEGAEVAVGGPLYKLDDSGAPVTAAPAAPAPVEAPAAVAAAPLSPPSVPSPAGPSMTASGTKTTIKVPTMGESITSGVLKEIKVKVGDIISPDGVVATLETDKVTIDVHSPFAGEILEFLAKEGDEVEVGKPLFTIMEGVIVLPPVPAPVAKAAPAPAAAAPVAPAPSKPAPAPSKPAPAAAPAPAKKGDRSETRVKMTKMRQTIADRLKQSQNINAMLTTFQEVDMSALIDMRNTHKDEFEKSHGVKLGFMSAFVKASAAALREIPAVNAVIDNTTKEIVYRNYVDISVAVASPTGLVVPVLRNTEVMSFADVEKSIAGYSKKAKDGTLAIEDMVGGTFTISNGGVFGSLFGTPIINIPQSAILGVHATKPRAVVVNGKVEARPMMYLALTYDHRLIDGREAATFLKSIQKKLEDPNRLLLEL